MCATVSDLSCCFLTGRGHRSQWVTMSFWFIVNESNPEEFSREHTHTHRQKHTSSHIGSHGGVMSENLIAKWLRSHESLFRHTQPHTQTPFLQFQRCKNESYWTEIGSYIIYVNVRLFFFIYSTCELLFACSVSMEHAVSSLFQYTTKT